MNGFSGATGSPLSGAAVRWPQNDGFYAVLALALLFLALLVWALIQFFNRMPPERKRLDAVRVRELTARVRDDHYYRTVFFAYASLLSNIFFALSKAAAGVYFSSMWLVTLAFYYLVLCVIRSVLLYRSRMLTSIKDEEERKTGQWKLYQLCGILLLILTLALQAVVGLIVKNGSGYTYKDSLIFLVAAYDFFCLVRAMTYLIRDRKKAAPDLVAIKTVSFATSLVSMLSLQTAMLASFGGAAGETWKRTMNGITGTAVCLVLIFTGVHMIVRARKELHYQRDPAIK